MLRHIVFLYFDNNVYELFPLRTAMCYAGAATRGERGHDPEHCRLFVAQNTQSICSKLVPSRHLAGLNEKCHFEWCLQCVSAPKRHSIIQFPSCIFTVCVIQSMPFAVTLIACTLFSCIIMYSCLARNIV